MRSLPRSSFVLALALGALLLGGCRLKPFSELEDSAPVLSLDAIDGYPSGRFGEVFAAYGGSTSLGGVGRVAGSAGAGSPFLVFDVWTGGEIGSLNVRFDGCDDIPEDCEEGAGAALAHVPVWRGMRDCVLLSATRIGVGPSETEGTLRIQCEETAATTERLQRVSGVGFGTDLAALPEGHPLGAAIIGAPEAAGGGALYRLPQDGIAPVELDLPAMLTLSEGAGLGTALAVAPLPDDAFALDGPAALVLAAAPGEERVVVLAVGEADDGMTGVPQTTARLLGCLDGSAMRSPSAPLDQGSGMAAGDLDGDGMPEVIVGDAAAGSVRVARLADLGMAAGCGTPSDSDDPTTTTISCPSVEGVGCEGFGASAAVGDFDADGMGDLVVGAPSATADGTASGAVFVLPGGDPAGAMALYPAEADEGALIGEGVGVVPTQLESGGRAEVVAGAPGAGKIYVFLCTGLPGDAPGGTERCLEVASGS